MQRPERKLRGCVRPLTQSKQQLSKQQHEADKATAMTETHAGFAQQLQKQHDDSEQALARQAAQLQVGPATHLLREA